MLESPHGRRRSSHPLPALRDGNGHARPRARHAVDTRSVLDLSEVRPPFLVNLLDPPTGQTQTGDRARILTIFSPAAMPHFHLDDDVDEDDLDEDEDEDSDLDDEESDDDEDEDEEDLEDDVETWQVAQECP
jgi:hypothetical protein